MQSTLRNEFPHLFLNVWWQCGQELWTDGAHEASLSLGSQQTLFSLVLGHHLLTDGVREGSKERGVNAHHSLCRSGP